MNTKAIFRQALSFVAAVAASILCLVHFSLAAEQTNNTTGEPLLSHQLSNEVLLRQAQGIYDNAYQLYLSEHRGLTKSYLLLTRSEKASVGVKAVRAKVKGRTPLDAAKINAEHAQMLLANQQLLLVLLTTQKSALHYYIEQIALTQAVTDRFKLALDDLASYQLEIRLRVKDGSMNKAEVKPILSQDGIAGQKQKAIKEQQRLDWLMNNSTSKSKLLMSKIQGANDTLIKIQARNTLAQKKYVQAHSALSLKQAHLKKSPQQLLIELTQLEEELIWLKGAFNRSVTQFDGSKKQLAVAQKGLVRLPQRQGSLQNNLVHVEELEQAVKLAEQFVAYHTEHIKQQQTINSTLQNLLSHSEAVQVDGDVLSEHLFAMQVIVGILTENIQQGKVKLEQMARHSSSDKLIGVNDQVVQAIANAMSSKNMAQTQLAAVITVIDQSKNSRAQMQTDLMQMQKMLQTALKTQQINAGLKSLSAVQVVERFKSNAEKVLANQQSVKQAKDAYQAGLVAVELAQSTMAALKEPMLKVAQEEGSAQKKRIVARLHDFASIELPIQQQSFSDNKVNNDVKLALATNDVEHKQYLHFLVTKARVNAERETSRLALLAALKTLLQQLQSYVDELNQSNKLALQHHANAAELKKRVGRQELTGDNIPTGIAQALKQDTIAVLEKTLSDLVRQQIVLPQRVQSLEQKEDTAQSIQQLSTQVQELVGQRLDRLQDLVKWQQGLQGMQTNLSDPKHQSLQQSALRRLKSEDSLKEYLVSFVPSESSQNLTSILQQHIGELIGIENQQQNINRQLDDIAHLSKLAIQEKKLIEQLLPIFNKQVQHLKTVQQSQWVSIQIQFEPQHAEQIMSQFEQYSGHRFAMPTAIAKADQAGAIEQLAELLYQGYLQSAAAEHWIALFEKRRTVVPAGLGAEISRYQAQTAQLETEYASLQRRMDVLIGQSADKLPKTLPEQIPMTAEEKQLFVEGEINLLRSERLKANTHSGLMVALKLVLIASLSFGLLMYINRFAAGRIREEEEKEQSSSQNILVLSLLKGLGKSLVWAVALIMALHFVGFNVGAILAGLGIFGFAIAMASRELIANLIGGINVLIAKPFEVGDYILFDNKWCGVEKIGLQYTRLRHFKTNYTVIVPNSKLTEAPLINTNADHNSYRHNMELPLSRRCSAAKVELAVKLVKQLVENNDDVNLKRISVNNFDGYAFSIGLRYDVIDAGNLAKAFDSIQLGIIKLFADNNIEFSARPHYNLEPMVAEHSETVIGNEVKAEDR